MGGGGFIPREVLSRRSPRSCRGSKTLEEHGKGSTTGHNSSGLGSRLVLCRVRCYCDTLPSLNSSILFCEIVTAVVSSRVFKSSDTGRRLRRTFSVTSKPRLLSSQLPLPMCVCSAAAQQHHHLLTHSLDHEPRITEDTRVDRRASAPLQGF